MDYVFEVIVGPEGPCLAVGEKDGFLTRVAGPKPWGGGKMVRSFTVSQQRLLDALGLKPETLSVGGPKARTTDPGTSKLAALHSKPRAGTQRARLLAVIEAAGVHGLTAEEAATRTGIRLNSVSTRMSELVRGGHVTESTSGWRLTSGGERATIYVVASLARAAA